MRTDSRTETELVARAADDLDAFGELVERYRKSIQRQCHSRVGDWQYAEDLAQEAFIRAYLKLDQLSCPELFPNWLRRIASNVCNEFMRSPARRESAVDILSETEVADGPPPVQATALDTLPQETRACIELFYNSGLSYSEIAEALHTSVASVKGRLSRAKAVLRRELAELEPKTRSAFTKRVLDTLEQLKREDPKNREKAASKLRSALAPDRIDTALSWLANPDPLGRSYAIRVSRKYHSPRVRDALVDILLHDEWEENRLKAANALIAQRDASVIPYLEQAISDPWNPKDVASAGRSAIKQLQAMQPHTDTEAERLGFRRELAQAATDAKSRAELLRRLTAALGDPDPVVRKQAVKTLQELGDRRAVPAIARLLDDPVPGLHQAAARALGEIGGKRALDALVRALQVSEDRGLLQMVITSLSLIGDRSAVPYALAAINDKWHVWRRNGMLPMMAMGFVSAMAEPSDLPAIKDALDRLAANDPKRPQWCEWEWIKVLSRLGDKRHVPELAEALGKYPVTREITAGLARIGDAAAIGALKANLMSHPSHHAAEALAECGEPGIEALREALRHPDANLRLEVCSGLAVADERTIPAGPALPAHPAAARALRVELEDLAKRDPNGSIRLRAKVALKRESRHVTLPKSK